MRLGITAHGSPQWAVIIFRHEQSRLLHVRQDTPPEPGQLPVAGGQRQAALFARVPRLHGRREEEGQEEGQGPPKCCPKRSRNGRHRGLSAKRGPRRVKYPALSGGNRAGNAVFRRSCWVFRHDSQAVLRLPAGGQHPQPAPRDYVPPGEQERGPGGHQKAA
jgi:hypothetical protein